MARPRQPPRRPDGHTAEALARMLAEAGCRLADDPFPDGHPAVPAGRFAVRIRGRSASLHPIETGWTLPRSILAGTPDERTAALAPAAARQLEVQTRRHADAAATGPSADAPMHPASAIPVDHLLIDRTCAAIIAGDPDTEGVAATVRRLLAIAHAGPEPLQSHTLAIGASSVVERGSLRTAVLPVVIPGPRGGTAVTINGRTVTMRDTTLPDVALAALPGRPFGDLADLHPALSRRRIETIADRYGHLEVRLRREDVAIGTMDPCAS